MGSGHGRGHRRRYVRFPAECRVEYAATSGTGVGLTSEISSGGLFLKNRGALTLGAQVSCAIHLAEGEPPEKVHCTVRRIDGEGAGLEFRGDEKAPRARVRSFIEDHLFKRVLQSTSSPNATLAEIEQCATYFTEIGRHAEGLSVYREALRQRPADLSLHEAMADYLLDRLQSTPTSGGELVREIEEVLVAGQKLGASQALSSIAEQVDALRKKTRERTKVRREDLDREVDALLGNTPAPAGASRRADGADSTTTAKPGPGRADDERAAIDHERKALALERDAVRSEQAQLTLQQHQLEEGRAEIAKLRESLAEQQKVVDGQQRIYADKIREMSSMGSAGAAPFGDAFGTDTIQMSLEESDRQLSPSADDRKLPSARGGPAAPLEGSLEVSLESSGEDSAVQPSGFGVRLRRTLQANRPVVLVAAVIATIVIGWTISRWFRHHERPADAGIAKVKESQVPSTPTSEAGTEPVNTNAPRSSTAKPTTTEMPNAADEKASPTPRPGKKAPAESAANRAKTTHAAKRKPASQDGIYSIFDNVGGEDKTPQ